MQVRVTSLVLIVVMSAGVVGLMARQEDSGPSHEAMQEKLLDACAPIRGVFFNEAIKEVLLTLIDGEQVAIAMTVFRLTDPDILKALVAAAARGVVVELIVDPGALSTPYSKVAQLVQTPGVMVLEYHPIDISKNGGYKSLMHHKILMLVSTLGGRSIVCTGSFNPTHAASHGNKENLIVIEDPAVLQAYQREFECLKYECTHRSMPGMRSVVVTGDGAGGRRGKSGENKTTADMKSAVATDVFNRGAKKIPSDNFSRVLG